MGAGPSTERGSPTAPAEPRKTDYYDLLSVDRQATDEEIKKAYRKKALELHPDRNYGDVENATKKFAEVQSAYEVLSDPQERAWYDSHRDAILRGDDPDAAGATPEFYNVRMTTVDELYSLMRKFNSTVPFTDAPDGFFGILRDTFDELAHQEVVACEWDGLPIVEYPSFGKADDDYDTVAKPFYSAWSSFATRKNFIWKEKWRLSDAPDRRVRRLMEKENKKFREDAIQEFNEGVRSMVAFVRKRDPRYVPNTQTEAERQKILRDASAAQAARARAARQEELADYVVPDWAQSRDDNNGLEGEFSESEDESEVEAIECVVCDKVFKTEKQYETHEKSKKHLKAVQQLRREMRKENAGLDLDAPLAQTPSAAPASDPGDGGSALPDDAASAASETAETKATVINESVDTAGNESGPLRAAEGASGIDEGEDDDDDDEYAPRSAIEERLASSSAAKASPLLEAGADDDVERLSGQAGGMSLNEAGQAKKVGMAKAKRDKKAAKQAALGDASIQNQCAICRKPFDSKNKLYAHLKESGHTAPPPVASKASKPSKKKR